MNAKKGPTAFEIKTTISNVDIPACVTEEQFYAVMGNIYAALAKLYGEDEDTAALDGAGAADDRRTKTIYDETRKLWNLGLTDKRTHNKLIIRIWATNKVSADRVFLLSGLHEEYELRYIREDNYFTKQQE